MTVLNEYGKASLQYGLASTSNASIGSVHEVKCDSYAQRWTTNLLATFSLSSFFISCRLAFPYSFNTVTPLSPSHPPPVKKQHSSTAGLPQLKDMSGRNLVL